MPDNQYNVLACEMYYFQDERDLVQKEYCIKGIHMHTYTLTYAPPMWGSFALIHVFQVLKPNPILSPVLPLSVRGCYHTLMSNLKWGNSQLHL